jgi:hypothetical protein
VASPLKTGEVGLFSSTGCMVPQPFAVGGNQLYLEVLGCNWRPMLPGVNYANRMRLASDLQYSANLLSFEHEILFPVYVDLRIS